MEGCKVCGGSIGMLGDCIECGTCAICFPYGCTCVYEENDPYDIELFDPDDFTEEEELCGFPETGVLFHVLSSHLNGKEKK